MYHPKRIGINQTNHPPNTNLAPEIKYNNQPDAGGYIGQTPKMHMCYAIQWCLAQFGVKLSMHCAAINQMQGLH